MVRLFIVLALVFVFTLLVRELKRYFARDKKEEELRETFIQGDLVDIEFEIAEEKARQECVRSEIKGLKSVNNKKEEQ